MGKPMDDGRCLEFQDGVKDLWRGCEVIGVYRGGVVFWIDKDFYGVGTKTELFITGEVSIDEPVDDDRWTAELSGEQEPSARSRPVPKMPTVAMISSHESAPLTPAPWCETCVKPFG